MKTTTKMMTVIVMVLMNVNVGAVDTAEVQDRAENVLIAGRVGASYAEKVMQYVEYGAMSLAVEECDSLWSAAKRFSQANSEISAEDLYSVLTPEGKSKVEEYATTILRGIKTCRAL